MAVGVDDFKKALQLWASGVTVVTTSSERYGLQGMTVTAFSSVSANPPQILVCLNQNADTGTGIEESQNFAVNVLSTDQQNVSNQFAGGASQEERFANTNWSVSASGTPFLNDSILSLDCKVVNKVLVGTHWIVIGEIQESVCRDGEPLLYFSGSYRELAEK
ncbi:MAG: flavin reductase family protein [Methylococcales bacterium]|nr:flavin reductase family protein [Methylococcales bacterium]